MGESIDDCNALAVSQYGLTMDEQRIQSDNCPILCVLWIEPTAYWQYDRDTGEAREIPAHRWLIVACAGCYRF